MGKNSYCVYKHTAPNGKVYIGLTAREPKKRWRNGKGYELCTAFNRAIKKYGWDAITHEILFSGLSKDEACLKEQECIAFYDSANPEHGYNLTFGGENYTPNEEWRKRASAAQKEYYKNHPEACKRISETQIGKKLSEDTKAKMSAARKRYIAEHPETRELCRKTFKGMKRSKENCEKLRMANQKKISCVETGAVFDSVEDAARFAKVCRTSVSNYLTGRSKSCGGYHFQYC